MRASGEKATVAVNTDVPVLGKDVPGLEKGCSWLKKAMVTRALDLFGVCKPAVGHGGKSRE